MLGYHFGGFRRSTLLFKRLCAIINSTNRRLRRKNMKHFSMPEQVSPTLEIDELMRLKHSLEKNVSGEAAESIIKEIPLSVHSTPEIRAEWVEKLSAVLEDRFDEKTVKSIRQGCYCNENGRLEDTAESLKQLYLSLDKDLHRFVAALNENGAGWFMKGDQLYTKMFSCECPMLEKAKHSDSLTWCHCTAGYNKKLFEIVFEKPVHVEILQSIRQGFDFCLLRITVQ